MNRFLAATGGAALALTTTPAAAQVAASPPATGRVQIVKPLTLERIANLDFGTIVVQGDGTATLDTAGNITCTVDLTCSATGAPAEYKVTGTNNQQVTINKPNVTLTNTANPGTPLTLVLSGPSSVTLPNSGTTGVNFKLGGSITIPSSTRGGLYTGDMTVTVQY